LLTQFYERKFVSVFLKKKKSDPKIDLLFRRFFVGVIFNENGF
jgi:hypothetical protein